MCDYCKNIDKHAALGGWPKDLRENIHCFHTSTFLKLNKAFLKYHEKPADFFFFSL